MNVLNTFRGVSRVKQQQAHQHEHFQVKERTRRCHTTCRYTCEITDYMTGISFAYIPEQTFPTSKRYDNGTQRNDLVGSYALSSF